MNEENSPSLSWFIQAVDCIMAEEEDSESFAEDLPDDEDE